MAKMMPTSPRGIMPMPMSTLSARSRPRRPPTPACRGSPRGAALPPEPRTAGRAIADVGVEADLHEEHRDERFAVEPKSRSTRA